MIHTETVMEEDEIMDAVKEINREQWFTVPELWKFGGTKYNCTAEDNVNTIDHFTQSIN